MPTIATSHLVMEKTTRQNISTDELVSGDTRLQEIGSSLFCVG